MSNLDHTVGRVDPQVACHADSTSACQIDDGVEQRITAKAFLRQKALKASGLSRARMGASHTTPSRSAM